MKKMTTACFIALLLCLCPLFCMAQANQNDSLALVALYNTTDGANWTKTWNLTQPLNEWYGVVLDINGRVKELKLSYNYITGSIPPELGNLMNLTHLYLSDNILQGNIPPELGNLTNLTYLYLTYNNILGSIPPELGNLTNLTNLSLGFNDITGNIPPELGNLTNLTYLDLFANNLSNIPPELGNLTNLTHLDLSGNNLSNIPPELGNLTNLTHLDLSVINLSNIPPELSNLTNLTNLDLGYNNITGIPPELGNLTNLTYLSLMSNNITSIPLELGNLTNLTNLYLSYNYIAGNIPPALGNLTNLTGLYLNNNDITGSIPPELGNLTNLTYLRLNYNYITGSIPPEIGNLTNLTHLYLDNNQLNGCYDENLMNLCGISVSMEGNLNLYVSWEDFCAIGVGCGDGTQCHIEDWTALKALYESTDGDNWSDNSGWGQIMGTTPPVGCYLGGMYGVTLDENGRIIELNLSYNQLKGSIPIELGNLTNLTHLDLSGNNLSNIPPELGNLTNLTHLDLSGINLSNIPPELGNLTNLTHLDLSYNNITGIPPELGNLTNLTHLDLRSNNITGIPPELGNLTNLTNLDLGSNNITIIPPELGNLTNLTNLDLSYNYIAGNILPELGNLTNLTNLSLSRNNITGIPPALGNLTNLTGLYLNNNDITGSIPPELGNLTNLTNLDLRSNDITGSIPPALGNLTNLTNLDLGSNDITGSIPSALGNLTNLTYLYLGSNDITDSIPPELGNLTNLNQLDLDNNQLSGIIPPFHSFNHNLFAILSVSYNNFSHEDIATNYSVNSMTNYWYSPQYYGEVQSHIVTLDTTMTLELSTPLPGNNNQNVSYQWKRNDDTLVAAVDSIYLINNLQLSDVGKYTLHMTDSTRVEDLEVISKPIYVIVPGYDLYGQPVEYNQLIIEFDDLEDKEDYEVNHLFPNGAFETDHCSCNRPLYLYQFPNDTIAFQTLLDIDTKKERTTRRGRVDGSFNNILGIGPVPGTQGWTWESDYPHNYSDSVSIFLLDSGTDIQNWDATPYLDGNAPVDSCFNIPPYQGYDYVDTLTSIQGGFVDSIGHGTFGMRSIAEGSNVYMNMNIVPIKVFDKDGKGTLFNFICALYHAIDHDADIINISAGYTGQASDILEEAVALAHSKGQFIVTATGNEGVNIDSFPQYPAYYAKPFYKTAYHGGDSLVHYNNIISVAAIDVMDSLWQYSNYGKEAATVSAYGENMGGYSHTGEEVSYSGTSISTYFVTRQLAAEIARDTTPRSLENIWSDFEANYLRDCPATNELTSTGMCLDISLREVYGDLRVFLEGAFDKSRDTMHTTLNTLRHILPGQIDSTFNDTLAVQPYNIAPFHYDGIERVPTIFSNYPPEVVDWILVSARTEIDADSTVSRTAAWLLEDGRIQLLKPLFDELVNAPDSVYIVIEHRNHIGVMSPQKLPVDRNVIVWDFTAQDSYTSTGIGQKMLNDLRWGMLSGDTNSGLDGYDINGCDKGFWMDDNGKFNLYLPTDFNMNGDVNGEDKVLWFNNNGHFSSVPRY